MWRMIPPAKARSASLPAIMRRARANSPWCGCAASIYRNDPMLGIASPMRPPSDFSFSKCVMKAGMIWDEVERAGLSGVPAYGAMNSAAARMFNVIAIKQAYPGHARQAGLLAASSQSGSYLGRFVVVVDEDVDPTDIFDVMWAVCTRCDPAADIEFFRRAWSSPLDPLLDAASSTIRAPSSTPAGRSSGSRNSRRSPARARNWLPRCGRNSPRSSPSYDVHSCCEGGDSACRGFLMPR